MPPPRRRACRALGCVAGLLAVLGTGGCGVVAQAFVDSLLDVDRDKRCDRPSLARPGERPHPAVQRPARDASEDLSPPCPPGDET